MKIGIIGAGRMGGTLTVLLARAGHTVLPANAKGGDSLNDLEAEAGPNAHAVTPAEAAEQAELVIIALPLGTKDGLPKATAVAGKIVVDAMNGFGAAGAGSTERTARSLPGARVVKAFNTLNFQTMRQSAGLTGDHRLALFVASDDADAKKVVASLIADIGFIAVDTGSLRDGGQQQQPGGPVFNKPLTEQAARAKVHALS